MFNIDDIGLRELDWTKSRLQKFQVWKCDLSFSTWKSLLSLPSLESLELSTLSGRDREEPPGRIPRHVLSRNYIFRSLPAQCRSIRNLIINWRETDIRDVETLIRFFDVEKLTVDLRWLALGEGEPVPPPEAFSEMFSRLCGLIDQKAHSKLYFVFDSLQISTILSGFPDVLRTLLGFRAVVSIAITLHVSLDEHSSQCLRIVTEHGEHLQRLNISGIEAKEDEIVKIISSLPRLQYLAANSYPTPSFAEAVDAHSNLLQFDLELASGVDSDKKLAERARDRIGTSLCRNRANRFTQRIASRTTYLETGAGLKLWPTILSNVDKDNVAAVSGVFQAFRNDIGRLLLGEMVQGMQPPPSEKIAGRKRSREKEADNSQD